MGTERFDDAAKDWDTKPRRVQLAHVIAGAIKSSLMLDKEMTGLDYGCGTGLVTLEVAPEIRKMYGLDTSRGMISALEEKISRQEVMNVAPFHGELHDLHIPPLDLIMISMTLHHIKKHQELLSQCGDFLKPGGILVIADLEKEDGSFHEDNQDIAHFGFETALLGHQLQNCGFTRIKTQTIYTISRKDRDYPVFLLSAEKI
jgi:ubiquinone/menaquinone biosynthesis C-methylase UbiE